MSEGLKLTLKGEAQSLKGEITGKGSLEIKFHLTQASVNFDYRSPEKVLLKVAASQGFKLKGGRDLVLSGELTRDLINRLWEGKMSLKVEICKNVAAQIKQSFSPKGYKANLRITLKI